MKISLVIPAYNEEKWIKSCLNHVQNNSGGKFHEIIVVDNASTDSTAKIASTFKNVKVVHENKRGLTHARQRGFLESTGDIIAYIDSDNRMPTGWVEKIIQTFAKNERIVCLSGPYLYYDLTLLKNIFINLWYIGVRPFYYIIGYMVTGGNFAIRRETLLKMKGFDTSIKFYGEDTNIGRRAYVFGKVLFDPKFIMPTSARRLYNQGLLTTAWIYAINFLSEVFLKKPLTSDYKDFR